MAIVFSIGVFLGNIMTNIIKILDKDILYKIGITYEYDCPKRTSEAQSHIRYINRIRESYSNKKTAP